MYALCLLAYLKAQHYGSKYSAVQSLTSAPNDGKRTSDYSLKYNEESFMSMF